MAKNFEDNLEVPQKIFELYNKTMKRKDFYIFNNKIFQTLCAYFKMNLENQLHTTPNSHQTFNTYFVFLVPTKWTNILDDLKQLVIAPLLKTAGVVSPTNVGESIAFITELEAFVTSRQLTANRNTTVPTYFQSENRCIMYDISMYDESLEVSPVYFQFKEDSSLELFNDDRFFVPKVLKLYDGRRFSNLCKEGIDLVKQRIAEDVLKTEHPFDTAEFYPEDGHYNKGISQVLPYIYV